MSGTDIAWAYGFGLFSYTKPFQPLDDRFENLHSLPSPGIGVSLSACIRRPSFALARMSPSSPHPSLPLNARGKCQRYHLFPNLHVPCAKGPCECHREPSWSGRGLVEFCGRRWRFGGVYSKPSPCPRGVRSTCKVRLGLRVKAGTQTSSDDRSWCWFIESRLSSCGHRFCRMAKLIRGSSLLSKGPYVAHAQVTRLRYAGRHPLDPEMPRETEGLNTSCRSFAHLVYHRGDKTIDSGKPIIFTRQGVHCYCPPGVVSPDAQ